MLSKIVLLDTAIPSAVSSSYILVLPLNETMLFFKQINNFACLTVESRSEKLYKKLKSFKSILAL